MKISGHNIDISNTEKVFYKKEKFTKGDVIEYYKDMSEYILPYLKDRPLMLQRFPDGIDKDGFYQKEASDYFPNWIKTKSLKKEDGKVNHVICNDKATLVYLANQGTITFHGWLSTIEKIKNPDKLVIDLDPPSSDFEIVREAAFLIKGTLEKMDVTSFVNTTGSSGVHVVIMLDGKSDFDQSREFAKNLGEYLSEQHSDVFTTATRKEKRNGKLYFDIQRNAYGQTAVTPYSLRPIENAPIATPLDWNELKDKSINSRSYDLTNIKRRLSKKEDPWKGARRSSYGINSLSDRLKKLK
ncbi:non-homologous end-joining DNA ligase [Mangrovivirga sp. M17]|uniref:Non-homologous end-joining DNA ligase n=1 Tax=Mangrovivirga halotolerans TaxID=2993936 RepID=A0ABT3RP37_9BACT|nr:non-homologous end-joining DNA ligase [Mangrovivirga halotolerans]MCX2743241.1 non-homologous end-joining DNA ligase [Mangrovivirga halotolerans]